MIVSCSTGFGLACTQGGEHACGYGKAYGQGLAVGACKGLALWARDFGGRVSGEGAGALEMRNRTLSLLQQCLHLPHHSFRALLGARAGHDGSARRAPAW